MFLTVAITNYYKSNGFKQQKLILWGTIPELQNQNLHFYQVQEIHMPLNFILKFVMHCHGQFLLSFCSLWKCRYMTIETVMVIWKKIMNPVLPVTRLSHQALASPRVVRLTHPLSRLMGNNCYMDDMERLVALWNVSLSTCGWNWDICLSPHHSVDSCSEVTFFSHLKWSFNL